MFDAVSLAFDDHNRLSENRCMADSKVTFNNWYYACKAIFVKLCETLIFIPWRVYPPIYTVRKTPVSLIAVHIWAFEEALDECDGLDNWGDYYLALNHIKTVGRKPLSAPSQKIRGRGSRPCKPLYRVGKRRLLLLYFLFNTRLILLLTSSVEYLCLLMPSVCNPCLV
jgi:hypothetical protein